MIKKIFSTCAFLCLALNSFAQRGYSVRSYEAFGLPDGDEVGESLKVAIPLLLIGFLIAYIFMWSKKDTSKVSDASTNVGCFGVIIMAVGILFLFPLLTWIEYIFVNIMTLGFAIVIVGVIIFAIYSWLSKE
jgi:hypothetical protein